VLKQLVATLIQAIMPQPTLARLRRCYAMLARNIYGQTQQKLGVIFQRRYTPAARSRHNT
jgi:hypothetical protein